MSRLKNTEAVVAADNGKFVKAQAKSGNVMSLEVIKTSLNAKMSFTDMPTSVQCAAGMLAAEKARRNAPLSATRRLAESIPVFYENEKARAAHRRLTSLGNSAPGASSDACHAAKLADKIYFDHDQPIGHTDDGWEITDFWQIKRPGVLELSFASYVLPITDFFGINAVGDHDILAIEYKHTSSGDYALVFKGSDDAEDFDHDIGMQLMNDRLLGAEQDLVELRTATGKAGGRSGGGTLPTSCTQGGQTYKFITGHSLGG